MQTRTVDGNACQQREPNLRRHLEKDRIRPPMRYAYFFIKWTIRSEIESGSLKKSGRISYSSAENRSFELPPKNFTISRTVLV